ncbi:MAG TPA: hypothetical protein VF755_13005 [Catenuloplanes sp.]|jgi:hypothetical protein
MLLLTAATLACCCGVPGYLGWPIWQQYPASATLPSVVADLNRRSDTTSKQVEERLAAEMGAAHLMADQVFAGVYADKRGKRATVFGATGFWLQPDAELDAELNRVAGQYSLRELRAEETGERGSYLRCGTGRIDGTGVVVCGSADHGSLTTGVFTRLSMEDSSALLLRMRQEIIRPG